MPEPKSRCGLLIDYEYCTGCHACEVACQQEHGYKEGTGGMRVLEVIEELPKDKAYLAYIPFPTESCMLCEAGVHQGRKPACVQHCLADVIRHGPLDELAKELARKPRQVLWTPR